MATAKEIRIVPISATDANNLVKKIHYSGKVVRNSLLHLGVFLNGRCEGVMQFGPPMVKKYILPLVKDTKWNGVLELNRMAFSSALPKNSESRAIGYAMRLIKKTYPHVEWVLTFADATQCGDGTIYRASGFKLIGIKKNVNLAINPANGEVLQRMAAYHKKMERAFNTWKKLTGFQLKYIYFLNDTINQRLTVPIIPFSKIAELKAGMYLGKSCASSKESVAPANHAGEGGASPTDVLHKTLNGH